MTQDQTNDTEEAHLRAPEIEKYKNDLVTKALEENPQVNPQHLLAELDQKDPI